MSTLTQLAGGFEKLLGRLPGAIRKPVEHEWRPIQELFLRQRPPRLLVIGSPETDLHERMDALFSMSRGEKGAGNGPWRTYRFRGTLEYAIAENQETVREAIFSNRPDLFLIWEENLPWLSRAEAFAREHLGEPMQTLTVGGRDEALAAIGRALPLEARLEFARVTGEKTVQLEIAALLTRSATAVCTAIGAQPIPLADFPILTSLQVLMVAGIVQTTGREWGYRLVRDFLGALGANIGFGFLLREGTRAVVKLVPGWGNAISGAVAGAGTYAIGRAATAYFVEGLSLAETRRRFRLFRKKKPELPE